MSSTDLDALARALHAYEEQAAQLAERIAVIKQAILQHTAPGGTVEVDGRTLYKVMPGRRTFQQDKARDTLPADLLAACTRQVIDGNAVKRQSAAVWEQCCTIGQPYLQAAR